MSAIVHYAFKTDGGPHADWRVRNFTLTEALSEPFRLVIDVSVDDPALDLQAVSGLSCTFELQREGNDRSIHGVVARVEFSGIWQGLLLVRLYVVPAFHLLEQRFNSRMFQEMAVPEILKSVLGAGLKPYDRTANLDLKGTYPVREYCLQYDESDLAFAERLMQEEGIYYYFDHSGAKEVLVAIDKNASCPAAALISGGALQIGGGAAGIAEIESLRDFFWSAEMRSNHVALRAYDWTSPAANREAESAQGPGKTREIYRHGSSVRTDGYSGTKYGASDAKAQATLRYETEVAHQQLARGGGLVTTFAPGFTFELSGHAVADFDQKYVITRVVHQGESADLFSDGRGGADGNQPSYANTFECVPLKVTYRPPRTRPRPQIAGMQSARVVGPGGEEIFTDAHGRIKVQFPWDREGAGNDKSSCWMRVAQSWSGAGWGSIFIPRIGMEVLVSFLEGDPDRPIVVGCAFNGQNTPPYALPAEKTKSAIRTWSSPGGNGYNEIRFEDKAGAEELYFQAQKDQKILVKNDKAQKVGGNEKLLVEKDRERTIHGNQTLTVKLDDKSTIGGNQSLNVDKDREMVVLGAESEVIALSRSTSVGLDCAITIGTTLDLTVGGAESDTIGGNKSETVGGSKSESVGGSRSVSVGGSSSTDVSKAFSLTVAKNADITVSGEMKVSVTKDLTITGSAAIKQVAEKEFGISADKISLTAKKELSIKVGDALISLKKNGDITIKGGKITVDGSGAVKIKGSKVSGN